MYTIQESVGFLIGRICQSGKYDLLIPREIYSSWKQCTYWAREENLLNMLQLNYNQIDQTNNNQQQQKLIK